jgi:hypothetical protein
VVVGVTEVYVAISSAACVIVAENCLSTYLSHPIKVVIAVFLSANLFFLPIESALSAFTSNYSFKPYL